MTTGTAPAAVTTTEEFTQLWRTPPNFRLAPSLFQPEFAFPTTLDVLDRLRHDEGTKVTLLGQDPAVRTARALAFRRAPLDEVASWPFRLVHFDLKRFYADFLTGFQRQVMIPWRLFLTGLGFTWHRCYPVLFMSTAGCSSTYHVDNSHGLVWQVRGTKTFHSFRDPERHAPVDAAVLGEISSETSPPHDGVDRLSFSMGPGDLVWSHVLTPHWVTAESPLTLSINFSHGGLAMGGQYSDRDRALREHWDAHPEQAWLSDLRNVRY
ncbi:hypothetical protein [Streptomyces sp. NPDC012616]|uniref:hypothetical protein n=1 Tax=Streptomyces sp. NPDC012616 TaxID=3364840 RepID=UPI0036E6BFC1